MTLQAELAANVRRTLFTLLGAVVLVLLVACANIASLWGARGLARGRELAIRQALGAGKGRLSRLIVVEATLLSLGGAVLGLVLAAVAQRVLVANAPVSMPRASEIGLHGPVLAFGVAIGLIAGLVCALLPLRRVSDAALSASILGGVEQTLRRGLDCGNATDRRRDCHGKLADRRCRFVDSQLLKCRADVARVESARSCHGEVRSPVERYRRRDA